MNICDHICHTRGLNPWVMSCPICRCANRNFDSAVPEPEDWNDLINWNAPDPAKRPEKYRNLDEKYVGKEE